MKKLYLSEVINNTLLSEINRLNELMSTNLLIEAGGRFAPFLDLIPKVEQNFAKKIGKLSFEFDDAFSALRRATTDEEAILALSRLANQSPEIAKIVTPKVLSTLTTAEKNILKDIEAQTIDAVKKGQITLDEAKQFIDSEIDLVVRTQFKGVKDILKIESKQNVENIINRPIADPKTRGGKVVNAIMKTGEGWYTVLVQCGLNELEIASVTKIFPLRKLRAHVQSFTEHVNTTWFRNSIEPVVEEMMGKIKKFTETCNSASPDYDLLRDVNITLQSFKTNRKLNIDDLKNAIIQSMTDAGVDYKIVSKVREGLKDADPFNPENTSWVYDLINDGDMWVTNRLKELFNKEKLEFKSRFWKIANSTAAGLTTGIPRLFDEFMSPLLKKGYTLGLAHVYVAATIFHLVIFPASYALISGLILSVKFLSPNVRETYDSYIEYLQTLIKSKFEQEWKKKDPDGTIDWVSIWWPFEWHWDKLKNFLDRLVHGDFGWIGQYLKDVYDSIVNEGEYYIRKTKEKIKSSLDGIGFNKELYDCFSKVADFKNIDPQGKKFYLEFNVDGIKDANGIPEFKKGDGGWVGFVNGQWVWLDFGNEPVKCE